MPDKPEQSTTPLSDVFRFRCTWYRFCKFGGECDILRPSPPNSMSGLLGNAGACTQFSTHTLAKFSRASGIRRAHSRHALCVYACYIWLVYVPHWQCRVLLVVSNLLSEQSSSSFSTVGAVECVARHSIRFQLRSQGLCITLTPGRKSAKTLACATPICACLLVSPESLVSAGSISSWYDFAVGLHE